MMRRWIRPDLITAFLTIILLQMFERILTIASQDNIVNEFKWKEATQRILVVVILEILYQKIARINSFYIDTSISLFKCELKTFYYIRTASLEKPRLALILIGCATEIPKPN